MNSLLPLLCTNLLGRADFCWALSHCKIKAIMDKISIKSFYMKICLANNSKVVSYYNIIYDGLLFSRVRFITSNKSKCFCINNWVS